MYDFFSQLGILVSFLAGLLSFFAPCTFSLMPVYFAYITGEATHESKSHKHIILSGILFAFGFILFFVLLGLSFGGLGIILSKYAETIRVLGAIVLIIVGLCMLMRKSAFFGGFNISYDVKKFGFFTPLFLGTLLAFSSTPCVGPVIGAIITFSFDEQSFLMPLLYLCVYSLGFMVPFVIFGYVIHSFAKSKKMFNVFSQHFHVLSALLLVILGLIMLFDGFEFLTLWIQGFYSRFNIPYIS